jgi:hypothetical protein
MDSVCDLDKKIAYRKEFNKVNNTYKWRGGTGQEPLLHKEVRLSAFADLKQIWYPTTQAKELQINSQGSRDSADKLFEALRSDAKGQYEVLADSEAPATPTSGKGGRLREFNTPVVEASLSTRVRRTSSRVQTSSTTKSNPSDKLGNTSCSSTDSDASDGANSDLHEVYHSDDSEYEPSSAPSSDLEAEAEGEELPFSATTQSRRDKNHPSPRTSTARTLQRATFLHQRSPYAAPSASLPAHARQQPDKVVALPISKLSPPQLMGVGRPPLDSAVFNRTMFLGEFIQRLQDHLMGKHVPRRSSQSTLLPWFRCAQQYFHWLLGLRNASSDGGAHATSSSSTEQDPIEPRTTTIMRLSFSDLVEYHTVIAYWEELEEKDLPGRLVFTECWKQICNLAEAAATSYEERLLCTKSHNTVSEIQRRHRQDKTKAAKLCRFENFKLQWEAERAAASVPVEDLEHPQNERGGCANTFITPSNRATVCRYVFRRLRKLEPAMTRILHNLESGTGTICDPLSAADRCFLGVCLQVLCVMWLIYVIGCAPCSPRSPLQFILIVSTSQVVITMDTKPCRNGLCQHMSLEFGEQWADAMSKGLTDYDGIIVAAESKSSSETEMVGLAGSPWTRDVLRAYIDLVRPTLVCGMYACLALDERPTMTDAELESVHAEISK